MSQSYSNVQTSNMELTPMRVKYKGVDLGGTLGNVVVAMNYGVAPIKADQLGTTELDNRVSGFMCTVSFEIAETEFKDNWKIALPPSNLVTSGPNKQEYFASQIGFSHVAAAGQLILHPLSRVDADLSGDFLFYLAGARGESEITYGPEEQARLKAVFQIYPDMSLLPQRFFLHGDPAIGLIPASFTGPTYVGTGNGTMTATTVYSGQTITETITATLVTPVANGGVFHVQGSVGGSYGLATVGISFVHPRISFTINDGAVDFIVGDQFTIPTTAANYV